jgi:alanyl-tRNA synthetase
MSQQNPLTIVELRQSFIEFMTKRGYDLTKPDLLISGAFPTTFNVSGGPNFADYYLDKEKTDRENSVTTQHCIRHWDFENVGDGLHLSFFEMGVTTAFNGYSQFKLFQDHLDFIISHMGLPKQSLYVTVFGGGEVRSAQLDKDGETEKTWLSLGIDDKHVFLIPQEVPEEIAERLQSQKGQNAVAREAFVANAVEPVGGPRTEIFFDRGGPGRCKPMCIPGFCICGRFIEFWTSVHYTHRVEPVPSERDRQGEVILRIAPLGSDMRIYAAGFGLQRLMQIIFGKKNIYEIEPVPKISSIILRNIKEPLSESDYRHIYAIADHIQGLTFLLVEGVHQLVGKGNRSRKYQYRRYVKSLFSHFQAIGLPPDTSLLRLLVESVIDYYLKNVPYRELYYKQFIDLANITQEITSRMQLLDTEEMGS